MAAATLLDPDAGGEHVLTGPEALGYRDAATVITGATGRRELTGSPPRSFLDFVRACHAAEMSFHGDTNGEVN